MSVAQQLESAIEYTKLSSILERRGSTGPGTILTITPGSTVKEAADQMNNLGCGSAVVMEGNDLIGFVTERDFLTKFIPLGKTPDQVTVTEICTPAKDIKFVDTDTTVKDAMQFTVDYHCRHMVVLDKANMTAAGMLSVKDLVDFVRENLKKAEDGEVSKPW
eukprot:GFYU01007781.1.p1 GENE.GFYU01007781.1~~GFYU01007781.1.p1  ORF type:complete len:162 (-),score=53.82 GFYU01007781.1:252-737(-)